MVQVHVDVAGIGEILSSNSVLAIQYHMSKHNHAVKNADISNALAVYDQTTASYGIYHTSVVTREGHWKN